ncbi:MAG TPA: SPOR domain-containing protein [Stellaceae bacterium]|nr:SPOR domain-containing protein [Stellaceae bacterium]
MSYNLNQIDPEERIGRYAEPRDEAPQAAPRRILTAGMALLVMGLFAGALWFAYVAGLHHAAGSGGGDDIPLIRADSQPIKVKPANPGGMAIPDRNMLFYNETQPTVEHLLPPPEQPMARPAASPLAPAAAASVTLAASPPAAAIAAAGAEPGLRAPSARPERPAERPAAAAPAKLRHGLHETARAETAPTGAGGIRLQLGSVRSEGIARQEWDRIRRDNADLLGGLSGFAIRADLGGKGVYYRIQTGPVGDVARADQLCSKLRQRHLGCIIVR